MGDGFRSASSWLAVVVSGVSVLAVSVFSWWQMPIAREKLRHDLYDRRFAIYMAFHELLVAVVEKDNVDAELRKAIAAWAHSPFLLDTKLGDYLVELHKEAFRIAAQPKLIRDLGPTTVESIQLAAKFGPDKLVFGGKLTELVQAFEGFLKQQRLLEEKIGGAGWASLTARCRDAK